MVQLSNVDVTVTLVLGVLAVVRAAPVEGEAASVSRNKRSHRSSHATSSSSSALMFNGQYSWLCPQVLCSPVSPLCKEEESIVFEYSFYNPSGRKVDVRCQSCSYCLDRPRRGKRAINNPAHNPSRGCPATLTCPPVSSTCQSVKMTNVLVQDHHCRRCPACYDGMLVV